MAYPLTEKFTKLIREKKLFFLVDSIMMLEKDFGNEFYEYSEKLLALSQRMNGNPLESITLFTLKYLREQAVFKSTGRYTNNDFDVICKNVYNNVSVMEGYYLEGLMLTYAFWYLPFLTQRHFISKFLPKVERCSYGCEFGFGHGLYLLQILEGASESKAVGLDISPSAVKYTTRLLNASNIKSNRYSLKMSDVRDCSPFDNGELDWAVMTEVVEHLPEPLYALKEMARCLKQSGIAFISTVIDSNHIDHIYNFKCPQEIINMLKEADLRVIHSVECPTSKYIKGSYDKTNRLSFICERC